MSVALRGNLRDFGIADVFQLIGQQRKTGALEFTNRSERRIRLLFDQGSVVSAESVGDRPDAALGDLLTRCGRLRRDQVDALFAECDVSAQAFRRLVVNHRLLDADTLRELESLLTRDTIFELLRWSSGSFDFRAEPVEHERDVAQLLGAEQILMDGLRMVDEWHSFTADVPSEDAVFRRVDRFDSFQRRVSEPRQVEAADRVFALVDGRLPVRRIADLSELGIFDAVRALAQLRGAGIIELLADVGVRRVRRVRPLRSRSSNEIGARVALLVPFAVLLLAVLFSLRTPGPSAVVDGFAIEHHPLEAARSASALRRVRHAVDAFRLARDAWPAHLGELGPEVLATSERAAYYYRHRDDGAVLLAPER